MLQNIQKVIQHQCDTCRAAAHQVCRKHKKLNGQCIQNITDHDHQYGQRSVAVFHSITLFHKKSACRNSPDSRDLRLSPDTSVL